MKKKLYLICYKGEGIFDKLIRIITKGKYTHVGLATEDTISGNEISYMACREDFGTAIYSEPKEDIDMFEIHLKDSREPMCFYNGTKYVLEGSMISDMGYPALKREGTMGSVEWVANALYLGHPEKYSIDKLIEFSKLI